MNAQLSWIINHLGEDRAAQRGAVVPPIYQTSMFCYRSVAELRAAVADEQNTPFYTRGNNPTVDLLRVKLAALEGAEDAILLASGSAAIAAAVIAHVGQGEHVISVRKPYTWTRNLLSELLSRFGVETSYVDGRELAAFEAALKPNTRMVLVETPNSMTFELQDLAAIADFARRHGLVSLCDNSYASPLNQSPLAFGIDLVAHSATKYLNGHSDALAGVVCGRREAIRRIFRGPYMALGAALSPHDAWLLLRGLRTLPLRLRHSAEAAARIAAALEGHPKIRKVYFPGSANDPQRELAARQMRGGSGMLSIEIDGDAAGVERFCDALEHFLLACSWGGHESLALPVCAFYQGGNYPADALVPQTLVRLSIGLEDAEVLCQDLLQALERV